ncbi:hypothetical protein [Paenibacillus nasutitermitis]|uniref:Uncharacterized protein n=1 Tax=Paenibacillus nasutitermitis TaxID=1652958 RepID=A0A916ZIH7_9BACL|nr:hypothetical protein [Paenibacillus nasutitermitis]GGD98263.1 hypothetical protein GCM10010911_66320 [Paenibacillus nasutitermitis]
MNRIAGVMKMHSKDKWSWFLIPWLIILSSFIVNFIISFFAEEPIYTGGLASIYIYMFIMGLITLIQTFPFALGLSVRRTDYYLGTSAMIVLICAMYAVVLFLLGRIEIWTEAWGTGLHFFSLPYLNAGPVINQLWVPFVILLFMYYSGIVISSLYKRSGRNGMFIVSGIILLGGTIVGFLANYLDWYPAIFEWMGNQSAVNYALWMLPFIAVFALASYLLLRKATV